MLHTYYALDSVYDSEDSPWTYKTQRQRQVVEYVIAESRASAVVGETPAPRAGPLTQHGNPERWGWWRFSWELKEKAGKVTSSRGDPSVKVTNANESRSPLQRDLAARHHSTWNMPHSTFPRFVKFTATWVTFCVSTLIKTWVLRIVSLLQRYSSVTTDYKLIVSLGGAGRQ